MLKEYSPSSTYTSSSASSTVLQSNVPPLPTKRKLLSIKVPVVCLIIALSKVALISRSTGSSNMRTGPVMVGKSEVGGSKLPSIDPISLCSGELEIGSSKFPLQPKSASELSNCSKRSSSVVGFWDSISGIKSGSGADSAHWILKFSLVVTS